MTVDRQILGRLPSELAHHNALRAMLLAELPGLDAEMLADTLEGETNLHEMVAAIARSALEDEAMVDGLVKRLDDMKTRRDRLQRRADRKRALVLRVMSEASLMKLVAADFTLSVRSGSPTLEVVVEALVPDAYWKPQPPKLDRQSLITDLKQGVEIDGVRLAPAHPHLTIRTR